MLLCILKWTQRNDGCLFQAHHKSHQPLTDPFPIDQRSTGAQKPGEKFKLRVERKKHPIKAVCVHVCLLACPRGSSQEEMNVGGSRGFEPDPENNQKDRSIFWSPEVRADVCLTHSVITHGDSAKAFLCPSFDFPPSSLHHRQWTFYLKGHFLSFQYKSWWHKVFWISIIWNPRLMKGKILPDICTSMPLSCKWKPDAINK